jgi:hypothetical protein
MSLYDVASLSSVPSLSTAVLNAVISLSNLSELMAIRPCSTSSSHDWGFLALFRVDLTENK